MRKLTWFNHKRKNVNVDSLLVYNPSPATAIYEIDTVKSILFYLVRLSNYMIEQTSIHQSRFNSVWKSLAVGNKRGDALTKEIGIPSRFEAVTGFDSEHFTDEDSWEAIIHEADYQAYLEEIAKLAEVGSMSHKYRVIDKNGDVIWVQDRILPIYQFEADCFQLERIVTNISIQKEFEDSMKHELVKRK